MTDEESTSKSITLKLPSRQVSLIDQLKREYGVRSRGQVLEILLEGILGDVDESESGALATAAAVTNAVEETISPEVTSLVLIESPTQRRQQQDTSPSLPSTGGIDLPGFVSRRTSQLRDTLQAPRQNRSSNDAPLLSSVAIQDLQAAAQDHRIGSLHPDFERVPHRQVSSRLVQVTVANIQHTFVDKLRSVELVVVVEPDNPLCHPVHVWLVGHMVSCSPVENLPVCLLSKRTKSFTLVTRFPTFSFLLSTSVLSVSSTTPHPTATCLWKMKCNTTTNSKDGLIGSHLES